MIPKSVLVVCYKDTFGAETAVRKALHRAGILHSCINRDELSAGRLKKAGLIITVGGDGTFLRTARYVGRQPVLSVAANLRENEGFFARASKTDFERKLGLLLKGRHRIVSLSRLESTIRVKGRISRPELAVNEVYIGSAKPYLTARYVLKIGGRQEFQKSSGVLVSTAAGSTGWIGSAGGKRIPIHDRRMQYLVREPFFGRLTRPRLLQGMLPPDASLKIKSLNWNGVVVVDSHHHEHQFKEGAEITVRRAKVPLRLITF